MTRQAKIIISLTLCIFILLVLSRPAFAPVGVPTAATITTVRKTADEIVNNSTTLQNDDELFLAMAANETWIFRIFIQHVGNSTADFKTAITVPTGATINWNNSAGIVINAAETIVSTTVVTISGNPSDNVGATTETRLLSIVGIVINGSTAGNLRLQWAQNAATTVDTKVLTNSYLEAHK